MNPTNDSFYMNLTNTTDSGFIEEKPQTSIVPIIVFLILGTLGNGLVLFLLYRFSGEHKWRPFYRFVMALAINDFFGVALSAPFGIVRYASDFTFTFSHSLCDYMAFIQMFAILNSAGVVLSMSLDRFIAIVFPLKYSVSAKERRAHLFLMFGGALSLLLSTIPHLAGRHSRIFYPGTWCFVDFKSDASVDRGISLTYAFTGFIILCLVAVLNISVIITLVRQHCLTGNERKQQKTLSKKSKQMIAFLFAIVVLFAVCFIPLLINVFARPLRILQGMENFEVLGLRLAYVNFVLNPWLYILLRKETLAILQRFPCMRQCCQAKSQNKNSTESVSL